MQAAPNRDDTVRLSRGGLELDRAFKSENAFYYSFFRQVVSARTWREGLDAPALGFKRLPSPAQLLPAPECGRRT